MSAPDALRYPSPYSFDEKGDHAVVSLANEILALRPLGYEKISAYWSVSSDIDPQGFQESLRESAFGDMILPEGFSLIRPHHLDHPNFYGHHATRLGEPRDKFTVDKDNLQPVWLEAGESEYVHEDTEKYGPNCWFRQLKVTLSYAMDEYRGAQTLLLDGDSRNSNRGGPFRVVRSIISPVFIEDHRNQELMYDTHSTVVRSFPRQEELLALTGLIRQAFEARKAEPVTA